MNVLLSVSFSLWTSTNFFRLCWQKDQRLNWRCMSWQQLNCKLLPAWETESSFVAVYSIGIISEVATITNAGDIRISTECFFVFCFLFFFSTLKFGLGFEAVDKSWLGRQLNKQRPLNYSFLFIYIFQTPNVRKSSPIVLSKFVSIMPCSLNIQFSSVWDYWRS